MTDNQKEIAEKLFNNAGTIPFGSVAVELKIHAGKCVSVIHTVSENIRLKENEEGRPALK